MISTTTLQYQDHLIESINKMNNWLIDHSLAMCVEGYVVDGETYDTIFDMPLAVYSEGTLFLHSYPIYNIHEYNVDNCTSYDVVDEPLILANDTLLEWLARQTHVSGVAPFMLYDQFIASLRNDNTSLNNVTW